MNFCTLLYAVFLQRSLAIFKYADFERNRLLNN